MKARIKVGFASTIQATQYHPVTSTDEMEVEIEAKDEADLLDKMEHFQSLIRSRTIKNAIDGAKDFRDKRAEMLDLAESM